MGRRRLDIGLWGLGSFTAQRYKISNGIRSKQIRLCLLRCREASMCIWQTSINIAALARYTQPVRYTRVTLSMVYYKS